MFATERVSSVAVMATNKPQFNGALVLRDAAARGWNASMLARVAGKNPSTVTKFVRGDQQTAKVNADFARVLGRDPGRYVIQPSTSLRARSKSAAVQSRRRVVQRKGRVS